MLVKTSKDLKIYENTPKVENKNRQPMHIKIPQLVTVAHTGVFSLVLTFARWELNSKPSALPKLSVSIEETWKQATLPTGRSSIVTTEKMSGTVVVDVSCPQIS
jgi:hypothetical protein